MKEGTVLMSVLAGVVVIPVASVLIVRYQRKHTSKNYDERQKLAQGKAGQAAFLVMYLYLAVFLGIYAWQGMVYDASVSAAQVSWVLAVGVIAPMLVYHTCCFLTDAGLPLNKKPQQMFAAYCFSGVLEFLNYYLRCWLYPNSRDRFDGHLWLLISVSSTYLAVLYFMEWRRRRKEAHNGEE